MASPETVAAVQRALPELALQALELVTHAGSAPFFGLAVGALALGWDRRKGYVLAATLLASTGLNAALKAAFAWPRPPEGLRRVAARGFTFPSGHSQATGAFWGTLSRQARRRAVWAAGGAAVLLVPFSRVALGVHYPRDVVAGAAVGLAVAGAAWGLEVVLAPRLARLGVGTRLLLAVSGPAPILLVDLHGYGPAAAGLLAGLGAAYVLEGELSPDRPAGLGPLVGGALLAAPFLALRFLLSIHPALDWTLGLLAAGAAFLGGPWLARPRHAWTPA